MDFIGTAILLIVYLLHPQDWLHLEWLRPAALATVMGIVGILHRKQGRFFPELLRTPHDWLMLFYFSWILYASPNWRDGFDSVFSLFLFYVLIVNSISEFKQLKIFVQIWAWCLFIIASLAVASEYGFDPFDSFERTHGMWKGRLVLHLSNYHNPNSLGHSIAPLTAALYLLFFWKRRIFVKEVVAVLMIIPLSCVYLTESKGAYLVGFIAVIVGLTFGRPKSVQITILIIAVTIGWTSLLLLPRMKDMRSPRNEAGIRGRLEVFAFGLKMVNQNPYGVGIGQFETAFGQQSGTERSAHSSYVAVGAELGWRGVFFYLAVFYCSLRVLVAARTSSIEEERVRRVLTVMNAAFMVSGWMIYWPYSAAFFMLSATTAAFHRYLLDKQPLQEAPEIKPVPRTAMVPTFPTPPVPVWQRASQGTLLGKPVPIQTSPAGAPADTDQVEPGVVPAVAIKWRRFGLIDVAMVWLLTVLTIRFWDYIVTSM